MRLQQAFSLVFINENDVRTTECNKVGFRWWFTSRIALLNMPWLLHGLMRCNKDAALLDFKSEIARFSSKSFSCLRSRLFCFTATCLCWFEDNISEMFGEKYVHKVLCSTVILKIPEKRKWFHSKFVSWSFRFSYCVNYHLHDVYFQSARFHCRPWFRRGG